jgi:hypothetical protein
MIASSATNRSSADELITLADTSDQDRLKLLMFLDTLGQRLQFRFAEMSARLERVRVDLIDGDLQTELVVCVCGFRGRVVFHWDRDGPSLLVAGSMFGCSGALMGFFGQRPDGLVSCYGIHAACCGGASVCWRTVRVRVLGRCNASVVLGVGFLDGCTQECG